MGDLTSIQREIRVGVAGLGCEVSPASVALAQEMIYSHRVGDPARLFEKGPDLNLATLTATTGCPVRHALGTDGCVFLWLGVSAYTQPACVLFLDPALEDEQLILIAPWDTKGLIGHGIIGRTTNQADARAIIDHYSLEPEQGRELLADVLGLCYEHPTHYLRGDTPKPCYPGRSGAPYPTGASALSPAAHTFEARVLDEVPLMSNIIGLVIDPTALWASPKARGNLTQLRAWCRGNGVHLEELGATESLRDLIVQTGEFLLRKRGVL